jgi:hypothetical protein
MKIEKRNLRTLTGEKLPKPQLRFIIGGSEDDGDDYVYDGGTLPEVEVSCGGRESGGACWKSSSYKDASGELYSCRCFSGKTSDSSSETLICPCNCAY